MPSVHKATWFYEGTSWGWTESLWVSSPDDVHATTYKLARDLAKKRAKLFATEIKCKAIRVSTEGVSPDALLKYELIGPSFQNTSGGPLVVETADHPDVAVQIRCSNIDDRKHKFIFLRGIWDAVDINHGQYNPTYKDWQERMDAYLKKLVDDHWGWVGVVAKSPKVPLTGYTTSAVGCVTFNFADNLFPVLPVNTRAKIRLSGVNKVSAANGEQLVSVNSRTSCTTLKPLGLEPYRFGGVGSYATYDFIPIATAEDQKLVERKAGAPLLQSHGHRKAKARS